MNDPLARFQKSQLIAHEISDKKNKEGLHDYHAFTVMEKSEKVHRLQIRLASGATHSPAYSYLLDVCYDGLHGTELVLIYSFMQVKIKGKNLQSLITAIEKNDCAYLQDYNPNFFNPPKPNEAVIESIEVKMKEE